MWVFDGSGGDTREWTAWPPAGTVPFELLHLGWGPLDETGWSFQSDSIDLGGAAVSITRDDGEDMPVSVTLLAAWYGSQYAISMIPSGWTAEPGRAYTVRVDAAAQSVEYVVDLVDCD